MKYYVDKEYIENLIENSNNDNANLGYNPEVIAKYVHDNVMKQYALDIMPKEVSEAHYSGMLHVHDAEYYTLRPNCFNYDLRFFIKNGLVIDGKGVDGSVASAARSLEVLLNHLLQAFMAGAQVFSGGQGLANFNTFLAPLCRGRSYYDIKQCIQGFIFNCNMSLVAKGGQCIFTSVGLDMSVPNHLKDVPAVTFEGETIGKYKDYQREADMIFKAFLEVLNEKDASGQWHRFPNTLINIQDGDLDEYKGTCKILHELGANNPTLYYTNQSNYVKSIMGALTSDTPVMTDEGFKYPQNLSIGDKVMTYAEDGSKEWNRIYNIIPKIAPNKVYKITLDNNYQFKVTDNHKLPTNEGIVKSEDLKVGMELYDYVDKPFIPIDDYKSEFMGVFLADGYIRDSERIDGRSSNKIEFHIKQKWKKDKIIKLCLLNGYKYELIKRENDNTYVIYVNEKELRNQLNECYDYKGNKHFPTWIWNDKNIVANVIKGLMFDGRKGSKVRWDWSCSDLPLVIDVLYALSYIGRISTIYVDNRKGDTGNWRTNYRISFGLNYKPKNKTKIKSIELVDNDEMVYDLSIENNHNYVCGLGGIHSENCRTALPDNFTGVYDLDCLNTGNFAYTTLNLPLLALEAEGNVDRFYELLDKYCDIARKGLLNRRELVKDVIYNKHMSDFLLQRDKVSGIPLYDIDRTTITLGFCGLYECMKILNYNFGENIIQFINAKVKEYKLDDGLRWSVIASPAESASHRFAMIIHEKYPEVELNGTEGNYYLTNSSHIPVSHESDIIAHIKNADKFHPLTKGGNILHIWLGETYHDPIAIWKLNKKILKTNTNFWAFTTSFTYCNICHNTFNEALDECSICGSNDLTVYSRITGYYVPVKNWNNGKKAEFKDRYLQGGV